MNYPILDEVIFALRRERDAYESRSADIEAAKYDGYSDAVDFSVRHLRYGTRLTAEQIGIYYGSLKALTEPRLRTH